MGREPKDGEIAIVWTKHHDVFIGAYDADLGGWGMRDGERFWKSPMVTHWTPLSDAKAAPQMREALEEVAKNPCVDDVNMTGDFYCMQRGDPDMCSSCLARTTLALTP